MKLYKPVFSILVIIVQFILSLNDYYELQEWRKANPELDSIINLLITYDTLFLFVFIIGFYEMLTRPGRFKMIIRIFLVCIILGTQFSEFVPIDSFYFGVYNTAWFSAVVAVPLILFRLGKYLFEKIQATKLTQI
ncbi:MAG: hypothetical protein Aureis2KO_08520 [Aureisphaera sp.]